MPGRTRLLTQNLVAELLVNVAAPETLEEACAATGVSSRSVRRWREEGERELAGLSPEGTLALALQRIEAERERLDWRSAAAALEELGDLDSLLAGFDRRPTLD